MIEYEELKQRLIGSEKTITNLKEALAIDSLIKEIAELEELSAAPDFGMIWKKARKQCRKLACSKQRLQHMKM